MRTANESFPQLWFFWGACVNKIKRKHHPNVEQWRFQTPHFCAPSYLQRCPVTSTHSLCTQFKAVGSKVVLHSKTAYLQLQSRPNTNACRTFQTFTSLELCTPLFWLHEIVIALKFLIQTWSCVNKIPVVCIGLQGVASFSTTITIEQRCLYEQKAGILPGNVSIPPFAAGAWPGETLVCVVQMVLYKTNIQDRAGPQIRPLPSTNILFCKVQSLSPPRWDAPAL